MKQARAKKSVVGNSVADKAGNEKKLSVVAWFQAFMQNPYFPGFLLLVLFIIIALCTYKDYGVSYDEQLQRTLGVLNYDYIFSGDQSLLSYPDRRYGPAFELVLIFLEKLMKLSDTQDVFYIRHLASHFFFLASSFSIYILALRLFKNKFIASLGFIMLVCSPRLYAHSFFNTKDIPFMDVMLITLAYCQFAFSKNTKIHYFILGALCGITTSIRVLGLLPFALMLAFLLVDIIQAARKSSNTKNALFNILVFISGFCLFVYMTWPYLWTDPFRNIAESLGEFSVYHWDGSILFNGINTTGTKVPASYFPVWFLVSNPELWLIAGVAGILMIGLKIVKQPIHFLSNTPDRNFLLYLFCFFAPIGIVIILHSVIYNDWRHLYFVYPSFILLALYCVNTILRTKYKLALQVLCTIQVLFTGVFMVSSHPFEQVYFNHFVSHKPNNLFKKYDMEYWGTSVKQALDFIVTTDTQKVISVNCYYARIFENNRLLYRDDKYYRFQYTPLDKADYYITNFWNDPDYVDFKDPVYTISILNSPIMSVYRVKKDTASQHKYRIAEILKAQRMILNKADNYELFALIANMYFTDNQYDSAEVYARRALNLDPSNPQAINNLANVYGASKQYAKAIQLLTASLTRDSRNPAPYARIGYAYMLMEKYDSAVYYARKSLSIDPGYNSSFEILAKTYYNKNIHDSAIKYERIAQKYNPAFSSH